MSMPTVMEAAASIRNGTQTARGLMESVLERVALAQPQLNCFSHIDSAAARAEADDVDRARAEGKAQGPLAGVPFAVKDLEDCAGMPTTRGSRWFLGSAPVNADAIHVARLRAAGAIPIGKTTTPEFGTWAYTASPALGITRNPWNLECTPGGSSGGSAAAVSAGVLPFATASDGGGSIRSPAGFCGLPGLKASYGRIPGLGVTTLSQNAVVGSLATTIADTALLLDVMAGPDRRDRTCLPPSNIRYSDVIETLEVEGLRVGWSADLGFAIVEDEIAVIVHDAMLALVNAGVMDLKSPTIRFDDFVPVYARIEGADMWIDVPADLYPARADELDPLVRPGWDNSEKVTLPKFASVYRKRRQIELECADLFEEIDVLITPTTSVAAFGAGGPMPTMIAGQRTHAGMSTPFTMFANICNLPSISLPAGRTADGRPVGMLVTADRHREDVCLRLGRILETARPWPRLAPLLGGA